MFPAESQPSRLLFPKRMQLAKLLREMMAATEESREFLQRVYRQLVNVIQGLPLFQAPRTGEVASTVNALDRRICLARRNIFAGRGPECTGDMWQYLIEIIREYGRTAFPFCARITSRMSCGVANMMRCSASIHCGCERGRQCISPYYGCAKR